MRDRTGMKRKPVAAERHSTYQYDVGLSGLGKIPIDMKPSALRIPNRLTICADNLRF